MSPVSFVLAFRLSFLAFSKSSEDGMQSLTKFRACCFVGEFDPPFDCSRHHAAQGMPEIRMSGAPGMQLKKDTNARIMHFGGRCIGKYTEEFYVHGDWPGPAVE